MNAEKARWLINDALLKRGFVFSKPPDGYVGTLKVRHLKFELLVKILDFNFIILPKVILLNKPDLPVSVLPHLEEDLGICYADKELLQLDPYNPDGSILRVLEEVRKTLEKSSAAVAPNEIEREYPYYWKGTELYAYKLDFNRGHIYTKPGSIPLLGEAGAFPAAGYSEGREVLVRTTTKPLTAHEDCKVPYTLEHLAIWIKHIPELDYEIILKSFAEEKAILIVGTNCTLGFYIKLPSDFIDVVKSTSITRYRTIADSLKRRAAQIELHRVRVRDISLTSITARNNIDQKSCLAGQSIAIVGCGTIGSHLARFLVQNGAGNGAALTLIDNETLDIGNLSRHLLNLEDVGENKAIALKKELMRFHPDLVINPIAGSITECEPRISGHSLIIDATGVESVAEFLNRKALLARSSKEYNLLHAGVFYGGISAQVFLNMGGDFACYRCLRPDMTQPWRLEPRKHPNEDGVAIVQNCGDGAFVPFSVGTSVSAAVLALEAVLDFFKGKTTPRLRYQVIDSEKAKQIKNQSPGRSSACPACGKQNE